MLDEREEMILAQAKHNLGLMGPRIETTRECLEVLEDAVATANNHTDWRDSTVELVQALVKSQLIQLRAGLAVGEADVADTKAVIARLEAKDSPLFTPVGGVRK